MKKQKNGEQSRRFIEAAREAGCSDDEAEFDENLKRIATAKPITKGPPKMPYSAHASRPALSAGCGLLICSASVSIGDTLAIEFTDNSRAGADVLSQSPSSLILFVNGTQKAFRAWTNGDDPLPMWQGPSSRWTAA